MIPLFAEISGQETYPAAKSFVPLALLPLLLLYNILVSYVSRPTVLVRTVCIGCVTSTGSLALQRIFVVFRTV